MTHRILLFFIFLWIIKLSTEASEPELLKTKDVHKIMEQILTYHDNKKELSQTTLLHGLRIYAEQFDPYKIYLLEDEVTPLLNPSPSTIQEGVKEYNNSNFSLFLTLNQRIQTAIQRARKWRSQIEKNSSTIFNEALKNSDREILYPKEYAKNIEELEERMKNHMLRFIDEQKQRYGGKVLKEQQSQTLRLYENEQRAFENQYLYLNDKNEPLPPAEQENLFAIHILKALASSLDAHTSFYNSREAYDMKVRLQKSFQGIGVALESSKEGTAISSLIPGGAAEKSGLLKVNDIIIEVNGESVVSNSIQEILDKLRDGKSTQVTLAIKRKGVQDPIKITLSKQEINLDQDRVTYSSEVFGDGVIGKITLRSFYQNNHSDVSASGDVAKAIEELNKQGSLRGLILDLRENSGGFLSQAVKVAGLFITNGVIVVSKYSDGEEKYYRDLDTRVAFRGPLIILTSRFTASAAEIVAQALQDYGVALIVGDEKTFGKGTIQTQTVTDNQSTSYFKVTVGKYYTVSGKTPQLTGVKADIIVPSRLNNEQIGEEFLEDVIPSKKSDVIEAAYKDKLSDVSPLAKAWYLEYYTPSLQPRERRWREMLPRLRKNSDYRIEHNKDYQLFLKGTLPHREDDDEWTSPLKAADFGQNDLQMGAVVDIVKDMIQIDSKSPLDSSPAQPIEAVR